MMWYSGRSQVSRDLRCVGSKEGTAAMTFFAELHGTDPVSAFLNLHTLNGRASKLVVARAQSILTADFASLSPVFREVYSLGVAVHLAHELKGIIGKKPCVERYTRQQLLEIMIDHAALKLNIERRVLDDATARVVHQCFSSRSPRHYSIRILSANRTIAARSFEELGNRLLLVARNFQRMGSI